MKSYEAMFIFRPDISEEQVKTAVEAIGGDITRAGGVLGENSISSKQRLAYPIGKHPDGYCCSLRFEAPPAAVENLKKRLKGNQELLRHLLTIRK